MKDYKELSFAKKKEYYSYLLQYISDNKAGLFDKVSKDRTRYLTLVVENIFQSHNASAILRSCDLFGVQDIHIVENNNSYEVNKDVALGSSKWLNIERYNEDIYNTKKAYKALREQGYRIVATTPHANDCLLDDLPLDKGKIALVFGTELEGLSDFAIENADEFVKIPMYGFTESFNISVSAALAMHHITEKLRKSDISWRLGESERLDIQIQWAKKVIKKSDLYENQYLNELK